VLIVRKYHHLSLTVTLALAAVCLSAQTTSGWKPFKSRGGWNISHPKEWRIGSCQSCKDPTAPGVFVDFFPPRMKTDEGWVMVEPLQDKPSRMTDDEWLADISRTDNLNSHIAEEKIRLNGFSALRVRYRTEGGEEIESVYVVSGSGTLAVTFSGDLNGSRPGVQLETLPNYHSYLQMLGTLRIAVP
jgi:hypothetical protein